MIDSKRLVYIFFIMFSLLLFLSETITRALGPSLQQAHGDLQIYYSVGHSIVVKKIPFKNLEFEYPLLSIIPFLIPFILYGKELTFDYYYYLYPRTVVIYAVITFVSSLLLLRKLGAPLLNLLTNLIVMVLFFLVLSPILLWRFDMFAAALVSVSLLLFSYNRIFASTALLALAIMSKLYAVIFLPFLSLYLIKAKKIKNLYLFLFTLGTCGLVALLLYIQNFRLLIYFLEYHKDRGINVESIWGNIFVLGKLIFNIPVKYEFNFGAHHIESPFVAPLLVLIPFTFVLLFSLTLYRYFKLYNKHAHYHLKLKLLLRFLCAGLMVFIVTNKVFSPQYLAWLLAFVPFMTGIEVLLLFIVSVCTTYLFPFHFQNLLDGHVPEMIILTIRTSLLIALTYRLIKNNDSDFEILYYIKKFLSFSEHKIRKLNRIDRNPHFPVFVSFALILLLYLILRLGWTNTIQFGYDQPKMAWQTVKFLTEGSFITSHGYNDVTPFGNFSWSSSFIFILSVFFSFSRDPIIVSQLIALYNIVGVVVVFYIGLRFFSVHVAIIASLFLTVHPWWTVFSRMIYSPSMGPTLVSICILLTCIVVTQIRSKLIGLVVFVWAVLSQIYISHLSVILVSFFAICYRSIKGINHRSLSRGMLASLILFLPMIYFFRVNPSMFFAYFKAPTQFDTPKTTIQERFIQVGTQYILVLSGGSFEYELGYAYKEFTDYISFFRFIPKIFSYIIILILLYSSVIVFVHRSTTRILRILLLLWALGPLWFLTLVQVPGILPRYFLLCLPAFSILCGLFISDLILFFRSWVTTFSLYCLSCVAASCWIIFIVLYYDFIGAYSYPRGFLSHFSDPPYEYAVKAMQWIEKDSTQKGYAKYTISSNRENYDEFDLVNAPLYYWKYQMKRSTNPTNSDGLYLLYYSPVKEKDKGMLGFRSGPYVVVDYTEIGKQ